MRVMQDIWAWHVKQKAVMPFALGIVPQGPESILMVPVYAMRVLWGRGVHIIAAGTAFALALQSTTHVFVTLDMGASDALM